MEHPLCAGLLLLLAVILAGCRAGPGHPRAQPGSYLAVPAHDPTWNDRFFVGATRPGRRDRPPRRAANRPASDQTASHPIVQDSPMRPGSAIVGAHPGRRRGGRCGRPAGAPDGDQRRRARRRFADIVTDGGAGIVLDAATGRWSAAGPGRRALRVIASLPEYQLRSTARRCARAAAAGTTLLVARGARACGGSNSPRPRFSRSPSPGPHRRVQLLLRRDRRCRAPRRRLRGRANDRDAAPRTRRAPRNRRWRRAHALRRRYTGLRRPRGRRPPRPAPASPRPRRRRRPDPAAPARDLSRPASRPGRASRRRRPPEAAALVR